MNYKKIETGYETTKSQLILIKYKTTHFVCQRNINIFLMLYKVAGK